MTRAVAAISLLMLTAALPLAALPPVAHAPAQAVPRTEPPKTDAAEPTFAEYDKARKVIADFNEALKKRNLPPLDEAKPGKQGPPGPPGKDGLPPAHEWVGTALRFKNPDGTWGALVDLRGPPGPTPAPPADPFLAAIQAAYDSPTTDKSALPAVVSVWQNLLPYVATDATTGDLFTRLKAGFTAAQLAGKLPLVMDVINKPLNDLMGPTSQPLTPALRTQVAGQIQKTLDALAKVK